MSLHADALAVLEGWRAPSPAQEALRTRYVEHLRAHEDGVLKACFPDHLTAGVIVVSSAADAVLLNHHRKAGAWLAFGGHLEPDDTGLRAAAERELVEESGLDAFDLDADPLCLDEHAVEFCSPRGTVHHLDVRYLAVADPAAGHEVSDESLDVRWWPVAALPETFEDMYGLIATALERVCETRSGPQSGPQSGS